MAALGLGASIVRTTESMVCTPADSWMRRAALLVKACLFFVFVEVCDAAKMPPRRRTKHTVEKDREGWHSGHNTGVFLCCMLFVLVMAPPILIFIWNVYNDPATPVVLRNASEMLTDRTIGFLSARTGRKAATPRGGPQLAKVRAKTT